MKRAIIAFHIATLVLATTSVLAEATATVGAFSAPGAPGLSHSIEHHQPPDVRIGVQASRTDRPAVATSTDIVTSPGLAGAAEKDALAAAVALLPQAPVRIAIIDVTQNRPRVRDYLLTLDAFTVKGNAVIYVVQQSQLLKGACAGSALYRTILATVLWHEMAHLSGADERGARQAEETLWMSFVRDGLTDQVTGLRYLNALKRRPDDQLLASR